MVGGSAARADVRVKKIIQTEFGLPRKENASFLSGGATVPDPGGEISPGARGEREDRARSVLGVSHQDAAGDVTRLHALPAVVAGIARCAPR
jgi:hypothetical protein